MEAKNRQTTRSKGGHRGGRGSSSDVERAVDDHPFCHSAATTSTTAAAADPLQTLDDSASTITTTAYYNYGGGGGGGGPNQIQNHSLVETASVLLNDDIIAGSPADGNRMSHARRFFCLLVTFDFLFTGLLWIMAVLVTGWNITSALHQQIVEYTIHSSMFDCVVLAFIRFFTCISFFAVLHIHHWWPVAITTALSSGFLIAKVFLFEWSRFEILTLDVALILFSFVLAWSEIWFLDFRVLPLEARARQVMDCYISRGGGGNTSERTPLLQQHQHLQSSSMLQRYIHATEVRSVAATNFYSPAGSPEASDDEGDEVLVAPNRTSTPVRYNKAELRMLGKDFLEDAWTMLNRSSDWKKEKDLADHGDLIESRVGENGRKIFRLSTQLAIPARILLEELFYRVESAPKWNPMVSECKIVKTIDSNTDILHQVCASAAGGAISARDFVYLRYWELVDGTYVCCVGSIEHAKVPEHPSYVRGGGGPSCFAMRQSATTPNKCTFQWLLNTDVKINLPRFIIENAIVTSQIEFISNLRAKVARLTKELGLDR